MEQNTPKFRLRLNLFDGIILILALGAGAFLMWRTLKPEPVDPGQIPAESMVRYTVRFLKWPEGSSTLIEQGDHLVDNIKKYEMGKVVSVQAEPAVTQVLDQENHRYVKAEIAGYEDILVTVEAPCTEDDENITVGGGYEVRAGQTAYIKGEGYMASGPIVAIDREVQG